MGARPRKEVLSVVERGWRGARECSLTLNAWAIPVTHLIKGYLSPELRAMVQPHPYIRIVSAPRVAFRIWLWGMLLWCTARGRIQWLLVDHERTLREVTWWCRMCGVILVVIHETAQGFTLELDGQQQMPLVSVFHL